MDIPIQASHTHSRPEGVIVSSDFIETRKLSKMRRQRNLFKIKNKKKKNLRKATNKTEANNLLDKEFKQ